MFDVDPQVLPQILNVSRNHARKRGSISIKMSYDKTYRVQGIPATFTEEDCRILLCSTLQEENEDPEPIVHSLGGDPCSQEFQIATVTFKKTPKRFQDSKEEWTLPMTRPRVYSDTIISSITVDNHFSGFTPLNSVRDISGPIIE